MSETANYKLRKQLKQASAAIDLIKISQRTQHTSIKEAMRKILKCISMLQELDIDSDNNLTQDKKKEKKDDTTNK